MTDKVALQIDGRVDRTERLHDDPPVEYDKTAWAVSETEDEAVLIECAVLPCPSCSEESFWKSGRVACGDCGRQRMVD